MKKDVMHLFLLVGFGALAILVIVQKGEMRQIDNPMFAQAQANRLLNIEFMVGCCVAMLAAYVLLQTHLSQAPKWAKAWIAMFCVAALLCVFYSCGS